MYNSKYFDGKLGKCQFLWLLPNHCDYGAYNAYEKNGEILNKIWIGRNTYWTEEKLRELLVHEMIHMYIRTIEKKKIDGLLGHGFRFRRQCRRLKRNYGLHIPIHSNFGKKFFYGYLIDKLLKVFSTTFCNSRSTICFHTSYSTKFITIVFSTNELSDCSVRINFTSVNQFD